MSNPDHETNAEKLTELLALKDQRIAELEAEVEKGFMLVKNRENKLRKRMAKVAELTNTGTVARQKDQLREQGQYIEALKAARVEDGERIAELEHILDDVSEVYLEITGGRIAKPETNPTLVLDYAREQYAEDLAAKDAEIERIHELYSLDRAEHDSRGGA